MKIRTIALFSTLLLLSGCAMDRAAVNGEPKWLDDPYVDKDTVAAVGCSIYPHFNGIRAQKKLAYSNAVDSIASQIATTIDNVTLRDKSYSNGVKGSSSVNATSLHSVNALTVSTRIKATFTKRNRDICVWVIKE